MILKICLIGLLGLAAGLAEDQPAAKKAAVKKTAAPPAEVKVPAGAKMIEPGTYTYTDAQGKKWIYRNTPFGMSKAEDKPVESNGPAPVLGSGITATEDGDTVRFEKPGPFGVYRWQKKKTELAD